MWFSILPRFIVLAGLLLLWSVIYKENKTFNIRELVSYLLIANSIRDMVDASMLKLSKEFINEIKLGTISSHLLRPINTKLFFYFRFFGNRMTNVVFDVGLLIMGLVINPPKNILGLGLFVISILVAIVMAYCLNVLVGMTAFWTTESSGFRNVTNQITRIFCGSLVPLTFFPPATRNIILLLPFPVLSYLPATFINGGEIKSENLVSLGVSVLWVTGFLVVINKLWLKGIEKYDAAGI